MTKQVLMLVTFSAVYYNASSQIIPNGDLKKWDEYGCPQSWNCNNDADCKGKITKADKINGGAKLTVMHCVDITKEDRSNNVNMGYDDLTAKILKNKKVKIGFDYSFTPIGNDVAYVKIDADFEEKTDVHGNTITGMFEYGGKKDGALKPGLNQHMDCYLNFDSQGEILNCPDDVVASSIRTTFGIMNAPGTDDVHKGTTLIINHVKFTTE